MKEQLERRAEHTETLSFEMYRKVCDSLVDSFRETGILDIEDYQRALHDPQTIFTTIADKKTPLLVPLKYATGYEVNRVPQLTNAENNFLLSVPVESIELENPVTLPENSAVLVEAPHSQSAEAKAALTALFGEHAKNVDFLDPRIPAEHAAAAMSVYGFNCESYTAQGEVKKVIDNDLLHGFERDTEERRLAGKEVNTKLFSGNQLRQEEELLEDLWQLCADKFEWLGDYHPVSMEEDKEFFKQIILHPDTYVGIRFDEEKPVAFSFFMRGLEQCDWLQDSFREEVTEQAKTANQDILYIHGIVSSSTPEKAGHYAKDIILMVSRAAQQRGGKYKIIFESTNLSSLYIPGMVEKYMQTEGLQVTTQVETIDTIDYYYITNNDLVHNDTETAQA